MAMGPEGASAGRRPGAFGPRLGAAAVGRPRVAFGVPVALGEARLLRPVGALAASAGPLRARGPRLSVWRSCCVAVRPDRCVVPPASGVLQRLLTRLWCGKKEERASVGGSGSHISSVPVCYVSTPPREFRSDPPTQNKYHFCGKR